jgi:glutathione synthase/RimK-type ligase-like ATP-grasp enzyme
VKRRPMLGLMTTDLPRKSEKKVLSPTWRLFAEAGRTAETPVIFFHPYDLSLAKRSVRGYMLDDSGEWRYGQAPLPSVAVDNVFVDIARKDRLYAKAKKALIKSGVTVLNPRLPDKRGVLRALKSDPALKPHLPETCEMLSARDAEEWLDRFESVFVKPARGSKGRGVLRIARTDGDRFTVTGQRGQVLTREQLHQLLFTRLTKERHLIQQGLSLVESDGCKIDLRVVLYRDGQRNWRPVATVPRVGAKGQAVTNLALGGRAGTLEWLYGVLKEQNLPLPSRGQIETVAVKTAAALTKIRPTLAFLGIDIGLDTSGHLYALDINPRPGRQVLSMEMRSQAFRHLTAFCKTLL